MTSSLVAYLVARCLRLNVVSSSAPSQTGFSLKDKMDGAGMGEDTVAVTTGTFAYGTKGVFAGGEQR